MKVFIVVATCAKAGFVDYTECDNNIGALDVPNGNLQCTGNTCKFKGCDKGYHRLSVNKPTAKNAKCKWTKKTNVYEWTKNPYSCATCDDLNPLADNDDFNINCSYTNSGGYQLKKCTFSCKNGEKIWPMNKKKMTNVMCKCNLNEDDGKCHWTKAGDVFDQGGMEDFSMWKCIPEAIPNGLTCSNQGNWADDSEKIVGGIDAAPHSWPWIVSLQESDYFHFCGGTILDNKTIVTAAHCCEDMDEIWVSVGDHLVKDVGDETRFKIKSKNIHMHPAYDNYSLQRDVCILKLSENDSIDLDGTTVAAACLPAQGASYHGETCWTAGWGSLGSGGSPNELQEVNVDIFDNAQCVNLYNNVYNEFNFDNQNMFCAGQPKGGKDSCQGDSGGPFVCADDNKPVLVGITSWGFGCAEKEHPGVYAEVSSTQIWGWIVSWLE